MKFYHEESRDIPIVAEPDILVAGAGPAGIGAAVAAARNGAKVMLIEKGAYPGGIATMGMMSHWSGATQCPLMIEIAERTMKAAALPTETNPGLTQHDQTWS
ncbi:MAG: FAD-dependent oxidoreductase, partial [Lentisphaeria bacterium]|nr:FAD-dependent oxidoreductase [Lentisphaeria bacterium]